MDASDDTRFGVPIGGRRILVADDSESYRRIIRGQLVARGLDVVVVASGSEALERLAAEPFDLLLVDGMMPGLDGPSTAREIRRREAAARLSRLPIIAITAGGQPEDRERVEAAGIDDLVVKPVLEPDLDLALARCLPGSVHRRTTVIPAAAEPGEQPASPTGAGRPVVDEMAFARLAVLGDAAFVERMVRLFLADAEGRVTQVEEAFAAGDVARLRVALEAIESIASTVGASALGRSAAEIAAEIRTQEGVAAAARSATTVGLGNDLDATRDRLRDLLSAMRAQPAP